MNVRFFFIVFLMFSWLNSVKAQYDFDTAEKNRMAQAMVKTQTQWAHEFVDGKPSVKGFKSCVSKYDTRGNKTEEANYNEAGEIISVIVYQYDSRDNRVNYERYKNNRQKLEYSQKIVYDTKGNKIREYGWDGATVYSNLYKYNENNKLSEINYSVDNVLVERRKLFYSGNKIDIQIFDSNNKLTYRQENTYNEKGLLLTEVKTGGQGNVVHTLDLQYNTVGDLMEETKKRAADKLDYQKSYQYDKDNRPVKEETINLDGKKFVSHEYQYNPLGDLVMETWKKTDRAKESSTKKFTYDSKGLYTEMECYYATYPLNILHKYSYEFY